MLADYIEAYKKALKEKDKKKQEQIEKDCRTFGMDKITLMMLAKEG